MRHWEMRPLEFFYRYDYDNEKCYLNANEYFKITHLKLPSKVLFSETITVSLPTQWEQLI